jgi:hypothetical protein
MASMENSQGLIRTAAVLQVSSRTMRPMMDFFANQLGFTASTEAGDGLWFAMLDRDGQTIMLNCTPNLFNLRRAKGWAAYFWVSDIEAIYTEFIASGANLKGHIIEKPYGCKEIVAIAPDGREIVFGQLL